MIGRRAFSSALAGLAMTLPLGIAPASAQEMTKVTFVQPSPSAINSFNVFVAIGEGCFAEKGRDITVEAINGSSAVLQAQSSGRVFSLILYLSIVGLALFLLVTLVQRKLVFWNREPVLRGVE